jgi:predicted secreted hydrolase
MFLVAGVWGCQPADTERGFAVTGLRVGSLLGEGQTGAAELGDGFHKARTPAQLMFPRDHGPHPRFRSEWWYFTAALTDNAGNAYGAQFTLFRHALTPGVALAGPNNPWQTHQLYLGHLAITDVSARTHREDQRLARAHPNLAGARATPFGVWIDGWTLGSDGDSLFPMRLGARGAGLALDLRLGGAGTKPVVLQGAAGFSAKGPDNASHYYSLPRIPVAGSLEIDDRRVNVAGLGWIDREWSTSVLGNGIVGWSWFGLHLDSGVDIMVFSLRRADGARDPFDAGTWIDGDGRVTRLGPAEFELSPGRVWRDAEDREWPVEWSLACTHCGSGLVIEAALDDQRMDTAVVYWEGLVNVLDREGNPRGNGYMELTGY